MMQSLQTTVDDDVPSPCDVCRHSERLRMGVRMITDIIGERQVTHGNFADTADHAQRIKSELRMMPNWNALSSQQREALEMIATKLARIGCGNPSEADHWQDIAGYATLASRQ